MYVFRTIACASLFLSVSVALMAADVTLKVEATRSQIYLGESFILQVNVANAGAAEPDLAAITNCRVRPLGAQNISNYSISFVNGQMTRQGFTGVILSFEITPLAAGSFRAGPVAVTADGARYTDPGPVITVTDIEKQDLVKVAIAASSETVLIDEPFDISLTVQVRRLPGRFAELEPLFTDTPPVLTVPWLSMDGIAGLTGPDMQRLLNRLLIQNNQAGFAINDYTREPDPFDFTSFFAGGKRRALFALDRRPARRDGQEYFEYCLATTYAPKDEGNYVGPVVFKGSVPVTVDSQGRARGVAVFAVGPACTVRVIPPPQEGRPSSFTGAIGSNLTASASLDASVCSVGDPLKLTLDLAGRVRFDKMLPPKLSLQTNLLAHFTVYDNTVQTARRDGGCQFIYTLRPTHPGAFQVPPVEVAYYDVTRRQYRAIRTQPLALDVKRASEVTASQIVGNTNRLQAAARAEDDRVQPPAPARADAAGAEPAALLGHPAWLAVAGAGPCLYLLGLAIRFVERHGARRKAALRRQRALPNAWRRLGAARRLGASDPAAGAAEFCAAIRHYLADRLGMPPGGITPGDARRLLADAGAAGGAADELAALYERYFNAAFSNQATVRDLTDDCGKLNTLIADIEQALRRAQRQEHHEHAS